MFSPTLLSSNLVGFSLAIAFALAGLALARWALFSDRANGRRRCGRCWYDMTGTITMICPECGWEAKAEPDLQRTRRRYRLLMPALALWLGAGYFALLPRASREGWGAVTPTPILVLMFQFNGAEWIIEGIEQRVMQPTSSMMRVGAGPLAGRPARWIGSIAAQRILHDDRPAARIRYIQWMDQHRSTLAADDEDRHAITKRILAQLGDADAQVRFAATVFAPDPAQLDDSVARLRTHLHHEDARVRRAAVLALSLLSRHDDAPLAAMIGELHHEDPEVRIEIIERLMRHTSQLRGHEALIAALHELGDDPAAKVRMDRVILLSQIHPEPRRIISPALDSADAQEICGALSALMGYPTLATDMIDRVARLLDHDDSLVRYHAAAVLPIIPTAQLRSVRTQIESLCDHRDPDVRDGVARALERLMEDD